MSFDPDCAFRMGSPAVNAITGMKACGIAWCLVSVCVADLAADPPVTKKAAARKKAAVGNNSDSLHDYTSKNFTVHTDLPPEEAKELLARLETMIVQVGRYWGKPNAQIIELYVVKDLAVWPAGAFSPEVFAVLSAGGGVTHSLTRSLINPATGKKQGHLGTKSVVYAIADRGTPQHEAVHAYCSQMFGTMGPTWFSEGVAELGHYWRDKDVSVHIDPEVLRYLQRNEPQPLSEIVDLRQRSGDSWRNYAWRWALCHLLAFNPNYSERFRPLGLNILSEQGGTFESVYGSMMPEIAFEYQFFLAHIDNGFRVDLCRWDWKTKAVPIRGNLIAQSKIEANRGWQPSRLLAKAGQTYEISATGEWSVANDQENMSPDGLPDGTGRLAGVLFDDNKLSNPFPLGSTARWTAPQDGALFLRCEEAWNSLDDNAGIISVKIKPVE